MPRGDKSLYSDKQKRKAEHIEQSYEQRGVPEEEAEARAQCHQLKKFPYKYHIISTQISTQETPL